MSTINSSFFDKLVNKLDRNRNNKIDPDEGRFVGWVGNNNGINGTREAKDALESGSATLVDFSLYASDARELAEDLAGGDYWISYRDVYISDAARHQITSSVSPLGPLPVGELAEALQRRYLAIDRDGISLTNEISSAHPPVPPRIDDRRPEPPPVSGLEPPHPYFDQIDPSRVVRRFSQFQYSPSGVVPGLQLAMSELRGLLLPASQQSELERQLVDIAKNKLVAVYGYSFDDKLSAAGDLFYQGFITSSEQQDLVNVLTRQHKRGLFR